MEWARLSLRKAIDDMEDKIKLYSSDGCSVIDVEILQDWLRCDLARIDFQGSQLEHLFKLTMETCFGETEMTKKQMWRTIVDETLRIGCDPSLVYESVKKIPSFD